MLGSERNVVEEMSAGAEELVAK